MRNDERCGSERDVRTSELFEKIRNYLDEDRRVYKGNEHTIGIWCGNWKNRIIHEDLNMGKICARFVSIVLSDKQKERLWWQQRDGWRESKLSLTLPTVTTLLPVTFGCASSWSRTKSRWSRTISRWENKGGCAKCHGHIHFEWIQSDLQEVAGVLQQNRLKLEVPITKLEFCNLKLINVSPAKCLKTFSLHLV